MYVLIFIVLLYSIEVPYEYNIILQLIPNK